MFQMIGALSGVGFILAMILFVVTSMLSILLPKESKTLKVFAIVTIAITGVSFVIYVIMFVWGITTPTTGGI